MSKHRYNGKWVSSEEMKNITLARQGVIAPQNKQEAIEEKPDRKAIKAELTALGVNFKGNAKTEALQELLTNAKAEPTSESEQ